MEWKREENNIIILEVNKIEEWKGRRNENKKKKEIRLQKK